MLCVLCVLSAALQRPLNTRDPVSLAGRDTNYRNTPISWKGPKHEKCIVDKVMVTSECVCVHTDVFGALLTRWIALLGRGGGGTNKNAGAGSVVCQQTVTHS